MTRYDGYSIFRSIRSSPRGQREREKEMKLSVDTSTLKTAIDSVKKQRSTDDTKLILQGVAFRLMENDVLCLEAIDGYRIASAMIPTAKHEDG